MATKIKDLRRGSYYQRGQFKSDYAGGRIVSYYTMTDSRSQLKVVADQQAADLGATHPDDATQKLLYTRARALDNNNAISIAQYGNPDGNANTGFTAPRTSLSTMSVTRFDDQDAPANTRVRSAAGPELDYHQYTKYEPLITLHVPVITVASNLNATAALAGKINSDAVTWGGKTWGSSLLRYDGLRETQLADGNYSAVYVFSARADGWYRYYADGVTERTEGKKLLGDLTAFGGTVFPTA